MRTLVVHMQTTLNNRIANADGVFWEPFPWGEEEMAWLNQRFRAADTWALGRRTYEAIVPWWDQVAAGEVPDDAPEITAADREFAALLKAMTKVVFSRTLESTGDRVVVGGDIAGELAALKRARRQGHPAVLRPGDPRAPGRHARPDRRVPAGRPPRRHRRWLAAVVLDRPLEHLLQRLTGGGGQLVEQLMGVLAHPNRRRRHH